MAMFELFNLPRGSIFNKNIPIQTLLTKVSLSSGDKLAELSSDIKHCTLYAILRKDTFDINCPESKDSYFNEILFLTVNIIDDANVEKIAKFILKAFPYQCVVVFEHADKYCISTGLVRDAKKRIGDRKIDEYYISSWYSKEQTDELSALDIDLMGKNSFASIYETIHNVNKEINNKYLTLLFVAKIYSYVHGSEFNLPDNINIQSRIKEMCPQNKYTNKKGKEIYRFSEEEVYDLICRTGGYGVGETLVETIYNFVEHEEDFDVNLPLRLQNEVEKYGDYYWGRVDGSDLESESNAESEADKLVFDEYEQSLRFSDVPVEVWLDWLMDDEERKYLERRERGHV